MDYNRKAVIHKVKSDIRFESLLDKSQQPEVLLTHPQEQVLPEFIENMKMWCFPNGVNYYTQDCRLIGNEQGGSEFEDVRQKDQLNHFVLTDEKGIQRYCTSLQYYEKVYVQNKKKHYSKLSKCFPKIAIRQFMKNPLILDEDTQLIYAPKAVSLVSQTPLFDLQRQFLVFFYNTYVIDRGLNRIEVQSFHVQQFETLVLAHGLNGAEQEWNSTEVRQWQSDSNILIQEKDLLEFYVSILFTINRDHEPKEFRISKFSILQEILRYRTNDHDILTLSNFSYRPMFSRLTLNNIIRLVVCILQEKQMIFFASDPSEIPQITEALLSFIKPLTWTHIYIPCSHIDIWEYANAIQPFIMGFNSHHASFIRANVPGKVFINLDSDQVDDDSGEEDKVPTGWIIELREKLSQIASTIRYSQKQKLQQWMEAVLRTKKCFQSFMLQVLQNVLIFLQPASAKERHIHSTLKGCFDVDGYLKAHPEPDFAGLLSGSTMMFSSFIQRVDDYYTFSKAADAPVVSYVQLMKVEAKKSHDFWKVVNQHQEKEIEKNLNEFLQPHTIDLYPLVVKYWKFQGLYNFKHNIRSAKSQKLIGLHFYDEQIRMSTRFNLNRKENLFSKFDTRKIVNLRKIFTHQCVHSIVQNYRVTPSATLGSFDNFDYGPILQRRKSVLRRQSTILQEQFASYRDENVKIIIDSMERQNLPQ